MRVIEKISMLKNRNLKYLTQSIYMDLISEDVDDRYMMLSSVCRKKKYSEINKDNYRNLTNMDVSDSFVLYEEAKVENWICNIQQLKDDYDGVIFAIYFDDCVCFYKIPFKFLKNIDGFSSNQHRDNRNESQIIMSKRNFDDIAIFKIKKLYYNNIFNEVIE